ncbi:MAG TPA: SPOR domain-containing protein [Anaeromyxobacteraceae bacterium]
MRENSRVRAESFALSLDSGQVTVAVLGSLLLLGGAFLLGMSAGRQAAGAHAATVATRAVLEHLDEPVTTREEPPPELEATQALTDARSTDRAMPAVVAKAKPTPAPAPAPTKTATKTAIRTAQDSQVGYTIQVASSTTRGDAERIVRQLSGRPARIAVADVPGRGRRYRVQVGSYPSQEAAKRQLPQLSRAGFHGVVLAIR